MEHVATLMLMMAGPLAASIAVGTNAKKINAAWRERRAAKQQTA